MRVREVMTRTLHTCSAEEPMNRAAQIMWEQDCGSVPVVDARARLIGMITDRDLAMAAYTQGKPLADIPIEVGMSRHLVVCEENAPIATAHRAMRQSGLRRLPVVDYTDKLVGVLTLTDLCHACESEGGTEAREVSNTIAKVLCHHRDEKIGAAL